MSQTFVLPQIGAAHDAQGQYEYTRAVELWEALGRLRETRPKRGEPEIMRRLCEAHAGVLGGLLVVTARMKSAMTFPSVLNGLETADYMRTLDDAMSANSGYDGAICVVLDRVGDGTPDLVVSSPGTGFAVLTDTPNDWETVKFTNSREQRITTWKNLLKRIGRRAAGC